MVWWSAVTSVWATPESEHKKGCKRSLFYHSSQGLVIAVQFAVQLDRRLVGQALDLAGD